jgi:hypothetical protein
VIIGNELGGAANILIPNPLPGEEGEGGAALAFSHSMAVWFFVKSP